METAPLHLIAFDPEHQLHDFLKEFQPLFRYTFTEEVSLEAVPNQIAARHPQALILVENQEKEKLYTFLQEIKSFQTLPIVYFTSAGAEARSFRHLKVELGVHFVLEQPVDKDEFAAVLRQLCGKQMGSSKEQEYLTPQLLAKYQDKIYEKIERIEELNKQVEKGERLKESLMELRNEVHKITGNAAPYGYPEAGKLCGAHEMYLYNLYSGTIGEVAPIVVQNSYFLRRLRLYFQQITPRMPKGAPAVETNALQRRASDVKPEELNIQLLTADFNLARYFQTAAAKRNIPLDIDENPDEYLKKYVTLTTPPLLLIVDDQFPFTKWHGLDLIRAIKAIPTAFTPHFGIITDADDLDKRVAWMQEGVEHIIKKPLTEQGVEYILQNALQARTPHPAKVLIVDDDEAEGALIKNVLESLHLTVHYLQDESKLLSSLENFVPDMLILDIQMPKYSGKLLLSALREDVRFKTLLILVVTSLTSYEIEEWAYQAKCDGIMHKPLNIPVFLARVTSLLERQREMTSKHDIDPITGLLLRDPFLQRIEQYCSQCPKKTKCGLVLLKIEQWEEVARALQPHEAQLVLLLFAELIKSHFVASLFLGYYGPGCFAFFNKNLSGGEMEFLIDSFYSKIHSKQWLRGNTQLKISANASIILFYSEAVALSEVIKAADISLEKAHHRGSNQIEMRWIGEGASQPVIGKQVILVDDDVDLCEIITFAFEQHGFAVQTFHSANEALHYFAKKQSLESNTLIVLDRQLPDGDGLDILRKIYDKFPEGIKAIFLSALSNEKEILQALRAGALDYITKPFSIDVLIEKASILLSK